MSDPCIASAGRFSPLFRENGLLYAAGLSIVLGLKQFYSCADAADLLWILAPVAQLAGLFAAIPFHWNPDAGFVNNSREIIIAPACAGVNFLIICFATLFFTAVSRLKGSGSKWSWLFISATIAYLVTLLANTMRIVLSIVLYDLPLYGGPVTPGRVHQLAGIIIYIGALVTVFMVAERFVRRTVRAGDQEQPPVRCGTVLVQVACRSLPVPFAWYVLVTVVVPLLNGAAARDGSRFAEHAALVGAVCLFITVILLSVDAVLKKRVDILRKTKEKNDRNHCL